MSTMKTGGDLLAKLSSAIASLMFIWAMFRQYVPDQLRLFVERYTKRILDAFSPYIEITFSEYSSNSLYKRSKAFALIETYLGSKTVTAQAKRLRADFVKHNQSRLVMTLDDYEEVTDVFNGIKVSWSSRKQSTSSSQTISFYPSANSNSKRLLTLTFHGRYRDIVTKSYIEHVIKEAKAIESRNRQRKLFTNSAGGSWSGWSRSGWNSMVFEHPARFETLAMDPNKKQEIINDLITFTKAKEYYAKIGKTWKRGYLLYGPPGTGKSTMIAAMANLLCYDVYDLELTAVRDNTELRKLLIDTTSKAIVVIEDIDCSLDLTGQRKKKKKKEVDDDPLLKDKKEDDESSSKVTLSGLLNIIDGLWSACEGERIVVFTTNFVDKLDPALTRRGRMDKHIEMSYCRFVGFKVLVKNYWGVDEHPLFDTIKILLDHETDMSPADVAENLMPKSAEDDADTCLASLVDALKEAAEKKASDLLKSNEESKEALDSKSAEESGLKSGKGEASESDKEASEEALDKGEASKSDKGASDEGLTLKSSEEKNE